MPDNLKQTGRQDDTRINVSQEHEVRYWCGELRVTPERLRELVREAGPMVKDVRQSFERRR